MYHIKIQKRFMHKSKHEYIKFKPSSQITFIQKMSAVHRWASKQTIGAWWAGVGPKCLTTWINVMECSHQQNKVRRMNKLGGKKTLVPYSGKYGTNLYIICTGAQILCTRSTKWLNFVPMKKKYFWLLSVEIASCYQSGTWNFVAAPGFLENLCTHNYMHPIFWF